MNDKQLIMNIFKKVSPPGGGGELEGAGGVICFF
jgi:hypothetical protein